MMLNSDADIYTVFIKGGAWPTLTEIASDLAFRNGTPTPLQTFFWGICNLNRAAAKTKLCFDDLDVNVSNASITDPNSTVWRLLSDFEGVAPFTAWVYDSSKETVEVVQGNQNNHYAKRTLNSD
jgi:hypothetical protein